MFFPFKLNGLTILYKIGRFKNLYPTDIFTIFFHKNGGISVHLSTY